MSRTNTQKFVWHMQKKRSGILQRSWPHPLACFLLPFSFTSTIEIHKYQFTGVLFHISVIQETRERFLVCFPPNILPFNSFAFLNVTSREHSFFFCEKSTSNKLNSMLFHYLEYQRQRGKKKKYITNFDSRNYTKTQDLAGVRVTPLATLACHLTSLFVLYPGSAIPAQKKHRAWAQLHLYRQTGDILD